MRVKDIEQNRPAPPIPDWFEKALLKRFGRNILGEPNIRLEWGQTPNVLIDGIRRLKWEYLDKRFWIKDKLRPHPQNPTILVQTHRCIEIGIPRWFACEWIPASLLGLGDWDENLMGPKPESGQYRSFLRLETPKGEYIPPSGAAIALIEEIWTARDRARQLHDLDAADSSPEEAHELKAKLSQVNRASEEFWNRQQDAFQSAIMPYMRRVLTRNPNKGALAHTRRKQANAASQNRTD